MSELPPGWAIAKISDITAYLSRGKQPKYISYSNLPVINQRAIRWFGIQNEYLKYVDPIQFDQWEPERFIQDGDILWNSTGTGTLGRACLVKPHDLEPPKVVDSHVTIVRPNQAAIDPRFLFSWVQSSEVQESIASLATGATNQIELSRAAIASICIPIAPLKEQKEIADKLDSLLARVNACRDRLDRVPLILKRFRQAVLATAVFGELTEDWRKENSNIESGSDLFIRLQEQFRGDFIHRIWNRQAEHSLPESWSYVPVEAVGEVFLGRQRSPQNHSGEHMHPYVRAANITWSGWSFSDVKEMNFNPRDFERYKLQIGDVLVNEGSGSADEVGKPAIWRGEIENCCFQNTLICVRPFEKMSEYLYLVFLHAALSKAFVEETRGIGIRHIGKERFAAFLIPLPPIREQQEIVRRVKTLFAYADRLEVRYQNADKRVEQITSALLSTAFRGELVPQNPSDEPATVLLERIRAEQLAKPKRVMVNRKPKMSKITEESVKEAICQLPKETFSFDELREKLSGDYDSLKDVLFTLLSEAEPSLIQVFDQDAKAMRFMRGNQ